MNINDDIEAYILSLPLIERKAFECAAFALHSDCIKIDRKTVMAICSYAEVIKDITSAEKLAIIGKAFEIFEEVIKNDNPHAVFNIKRIMN